MEYNGRGQKCIDAMGILSMWSYLWFKFNWIAFEANALVFHVECWVETDSMPFNRLAKTFIEAKPNQKMIINIYMHTDTVHCVYETDLFLISFSTLKLNWSPITQKMCVCFECVEDNFYKCKIRIVHVKFEFGLFLTPK